MAFKATADVVDGFTMFGAFGTFQLLQRIFCNLIPNSNKNPLKSYPLKAGCIAFQCKL